MSNIKRETDPKLFLEIFSDLSGMKSAAELLEFKTGQRNEQTRRAGVVGAVVVGSCANSQEYFENNMGPKDLDVVLVVDAVHEHGLEDYADNLKETFDREYSWRVKDLSFGRLDLLGYFLLHGSEIDELTYEVLQRAAVPLIMAFENEVAEQIEKILETLRNPENG